MTPKFEPKALTPVTIFGKLFQLRDIAHLNHLAIKGPGSYAGHKALNKLYEDVLDLTDSLVESYQGKYGIVTITIPESKLSPDVLATIKDLATMLENQTIFKETWVNNQIDEILKLLYSIIYKLTNLK